MTRLTGEENPITQPIFQIFFSNVWKALKMFNFDDGEIWVNSLPHRPALDVISAALFAIGVVLLLVRYIRNRHWLDSVFACIDSVIAVAVHAFAWHSPVKTRH